MKQPAKASLLGILIMGALLGAAGARAGDGGVAVAAATPSALSGPAAGGPVSAAAGDAAAAPDAGADAPAAASPPAAGASSGAKAADGGPAVAPELTTLNGILSALYGTISGAAGAPRDWERLRSLFTHEGRMVVHGMNKDGDMVTRVLTVSDYISRVTPLFAREGFYETELARTTETFGQIAHVFSTYESRHAQEDAKPFQRGINSIQLVNDGQRWWIQSLVWQAETDNNPLPARYLKGRP